MNIPKPPRHPEFSDIVCSSCRHWYQPGNKMVLQALSNGQVAAMPFADAVKSGAQINPENVVTLSQCTRFPQWQPKREDDWCGEHSAVMSAYAMKNWAKKAMEQ